MLLYKGNLHCRFISEPPRPIDRGTKDHWSLVPSVTVRPITCKQCIVLEVDYFLMTIVLSKTIFIFPYFLTFLIQVAHGDEGVTYTYSGTKIPAKPWTPVLNQIREKIQEVTQHSFNFVLVNR